MQESVKMQHTPSDPLKMGFVSIVGRPNVGKSTLLNHIIGQKVAITSRKAQTTRHNIVGIKTIDDTQVAFVDTPGMHVMNKGRDSALNKYMNYSANAAIKDVDVIVWVLDRYRFTHEDEIVLKKIKHKTAPVLIVFNKVDRLKDKSALLSSVDTLIKLLPKAEFFYVSAVNKKGIDSLMQRIIKLIPHGAWMYDAEQLTDKSSNFMASELVREKIMRQLGDELPYQITVDVLSFKYDLRNILHIHCVIIVDREGQKRIIIGDGGARIKLVGQDARIDMETLFGTKVMLNLWVKVKRGWSNNSNILKTLGYN